jgi:hypothetical protein
VQSRNTRGSLIGVPNLVGNRLLEQGPQGPRQNCLALLGPRGHPRNDAPPVVNPRHQLAPFPVLRRESLPVSLVLQPSEQVPGPGPRRLSIPLLLKTQEQQEFSLIFS